MSGNYIPPNVPLYLTPDNVPVGRFCRTLSIPDDPTWIGLVDGVLSALTNADLWRQSGALTPDEAASAWLAMLIDSWQIQGCPLDVRQNPDTPCILEKSDDGGATWTAFADLQACPPILQLANGGGLNVGYHVGEDITYFRVPDGETPASVADAWAAFVPTSAMVANTNDRCTAAVNTANVIKQTYIDIANNLPANVFATAGQLAADIAGALGWLIGAVATADIFATASVAVLALNLLFSVGSWTDVDFSILVCILYKHMSGSAGNWTFDYAGIQTDLAVQVATYKALPFDLIRAMITWFLPYPALEIASKTTAMTSFDCGCDKCFPDTWDFKLYPSAWQPQGGRAGMVWTHGQGYLGSAANGIRVNIQCVGGAVVKGVSGHAFISNTGGTNSLFCTLLRADLTTIVTSGGLSLSTPNQERSFSFNFSTNTQAVTYIGVYQAVSAPAQIIHDITVTT